LQGNRLERRGADAFGCANELEFDFFNSWEEYCHNGGMTFATGSSLEKAVVV